MVRLQRQLHREYPGRSLQWFDCLLGILHKPGVPDCCSPIRHCSIRRGKGSMFLLSGSHVYSDYRDTSLDTVLSLSSPLLGLC